MEKLFTPSNSQDYTEGQLSALNAEWYVICEREGLQYKSNKYSQRASEFCDEISRREAECDEILNKFMAHAHV